MIRFLSVILICMFVSACDMSNPDTTLVGEKQLKKVGETWFTVVNPSATGSDAQKSLMFFWEKGENEVISTTYPFGRIKFLIDESKQVPTAEFKFVHYANPPEKKDNFDNVLRYYVTEIVVRLRPETMQEIGALLHSQKAPTTSDGKIEK